MVDREVLSERLTLLGEYLEDLEELQGLTYDEFLQDKRVRRYVERTLQLAMECCLDLASHIIADLKLREPESYRDMFAVLAENSIVGRENLDALQKMAQLRNVLVRNYTRIDPEIVFGVLKRNIETFREFGRQVNALL